MTTLFYYYYYIYIILYVSLVRLLYFMGKAPNAPNILLASL